MGIPYRLKEDLRVTICCGSAFGDWPGISTHGKVRPLFTWDRAIMGREGDGLWAAARGEGREV